MSRDLAVQMQINGLGFVSFKAAAWGRQCGVRVGNASLNTLWRERSEFSVLGNAGISKGLGEWRTAAVQITQSHSRMGISETVGSLNRPSMRIFARIDTGVHTSYRQCAAQSNTFTPFTLPRVKDKIHQKKKKKKNSCSGKLEQSKTVTAVCTHQNKTKQKKMITKSVPQTYHTQTIIFLQELITVSKIG